MYVIPIGWRIRIIQENPEYKPYLGCHLRLGGSILLSGVHGTNSTYIGCWGKPRYDEKQPVTLGILDTTGNTGVMDTAVVPINKHNRTVPARNERAGERRANLNQLARGVIFKVVATVESVAFRTSANGNRYLLVKLVAEDGTSMKAMAFNTMYGQHRTACAATMEPGRMVRLSIKAAGNDVGFVHGVEVRRRLDHF